MMSFHVDRGTNVCVCVGVCVLGNYAVTLVEWVYSNRSQFIQTERVGCLALPSVH